MNRFFLHGQVLTTVSRNKKIKKTAYDFLMVYATRLCINNILSTHNSH